MTNLTYLIIAFIAWVPLAAIGFYQIGRSLGYHKGRRSGLQDGWILAQGGKISPGLTGLEAWEMPMVFPDGAVYRDGRIEQEEL